MSSPEAPWGRKRRRRHLQIGRELITTQMVLSQLNFTSDLDSSETLRLVINILPSHMSNKWVARAADIIETGRASVPCGGLLVLVLLVGLHLVLVVETFGFLSVGYIVMLLHL